MEFGVGGFVFFYVKGFLGVGDNLGCCPLSYYVFKLWHLPSIC